MRTGTVYLVGAGPGDPKLMTVRGRELLQHADVVAYDHLVSPRILRWCAPHAKRLYVGKEADRSFDSAHAKLRTSLRTVPSEANSRVEGRHAASQSTINRLLIRAAKSGKTVVRLKGGDPLLFGRGGEEALELQRAHVPFEIVPGVTSALAVPAYAGIPVTDRRYASSLAIATGHEDPQKPHSALRWAQLATACDTLVFLMGVSTLPGIVARLRRHGRGSTTPCAVIEWGTLPRQRTVTGTLSTIVSAARRERIAPPAVFVVGDVVRLRRRLQWFERKPLFGRRILVTRASEKAEALSDQLEALGAAVEELPAIVLAPIAANGAFREAVNALPQADWVFFTSPEGIGWLAKMLKPHRRDLRALSGCHIGAIGSKTAAAIESLGLHVDFIPKRFSQEGLLDALPRRMLAGKRALIFSAQESRDVLERGLRRRGMEVAKIPIYQTTVPAALRKRAAAIVRERYDVVTVTSASCVEHLAQALRASGHRSALKRLPFASIGPVTSAAVRAHGGRVLVEAKRSTVEGLVDALVKKFR